MIKPARRNAEVLIDIARQRACANLSLWWIGQSGVVCASDDQVVVFDPYLSDSLTAKYARTATPHVRISELVMTPWELRYAGPTVVTATHQHTDHMDPDTLRPLVCDHALTRLVAPAAWRSLAAERSGLGGSEILAIDAPDSVTVNRVRLTAVPAAHEKLERDERGNLLYLGFIAEIGGFVVYHSGDTIRFPELAQSLRRFHIDVAILPINGKLGNMSGRDAAQLAHDIGAKIVIPCHYDMFEFNTADPREQFVPECQRLGQPYRVLKLGERFTYPEDAR